MWPWSNVDRSLKDEQTLCKYRFKEEQILCKCIYKEEQTLCKYRFKEEQTLCKYRFKEEQTLCKYGFKEEQTLCKYIQTLLLTLVSKTEHATTVWTKHHREGELAFRSSIDTLFCTEVTVRHLACSWSPMVLCNIYTMPLARRPCLFAGIMMKMHSKCYIQH